MLTILGLRYVVTGCGRSGTVYMARLLTSVGVPCGHELFFDYRGLEAARRRLRGEETPCLSWVSRSRYDNGRWHELLPWLPEPERVEAESSYMAAPFLAEPPLADAAVIHVVRNPVRVVDSFCNHLDYFSEPVATNCYEHFIMTHLPELRGSMSCYDRAALYWVRWNEMVERRGPAYRHRVEDGPAGVLAFLGRSGPCFDEPVNSLRRPAGDRFSPDKIESREVRGLFLGLARAYGYDGLLERLML